MIRSWLFVPGHEERMLRKALASRADAVIIDWEDAVPRQLKERARTSTRQVLAEQAPSSLVGVRVDAARSDAFADDVAAASSLPLSFVMVPKTETPSDLGQIEPLGLRVVPLIESARGLESTLDIARSGEAVWRLAFGNLDFLADIGATWTPGGEALGYARSRLVIASRLAGLEPPLDGVFPLLDDLEGLEREARLAKTLGFGGKLLLHPKQIAVVQAAFSPSDAELRRARQVLLAVQEEAGNDRSAFRLGDSFVDPPVVRRALDILREAGEDVSAFLQAGPGEEPA